ncbi:unnamed protein product, partial [Discosporangium mesarthrocarpum]
SLAAEPTEAANNPRAQNYLGVMYLEGRGVVRDTVEAFRWFWQSSRQGYPQGCQNMAMCYEAGIGVTKDVAKAVELYRRAAEGHSIPAIHSLGYLLARDALHTLAAAAVQTPVSGVCKGKPRGGSRGGLKFEDPSRGLMVTGPETSLLADQVLREARTQLREAANLLRRAADNGVADASYQLGRLYQQGLGIPLDPVAAFESYKSAADCEPVHPTAG